MLPRKRVAMLNCSLEFLKSIPNSTVRCLTCGNLLLLILICWLACSVTLSAKETHLRRRNSLFRNQQQDLLGNQYELFRHKHSNHRSSRTRQQRRPRGRVVRKSRRLGHNKVNQLADQATQKAISLPSVQQLIPRDNQLTNNEITSIDAPHLNRQIIRQIRKRLVNMQDEINMMKALLDNLDSVNNFGQSTSTSLDLVGGGEGSQQQLGIPDINNFDKSSIQATEGNKNNLVPVNSLQPLPNDNKDLNIVKEPQTSTINQILPPSNYIEYNPMTNTALTTIDHVPSQDSSKSKRFPDDVFEETESGVNPIPTEKKSVDATISKVQEDSSTSYSSPNISPIEVEGSHSSSAEKELIDQWNDPLIRRHHQDHLNNQDHNDHRHYQDRQDHQNHQDLPNQQDIKSPQEQQFFQEPSIRVNQEHQFYLDPLGDRDLQSQQDVHSHQVPSNHKDLQILQNNQEHQLHQDILSQPDPAGHHDVRNHQVLPDHQDPASNQNLQNNQDAQRQQVFPSHQEHQLHQDVLSQPNPASHQNVRSHQVLPDHQNLQIFQDPTNNQNLQNNQDAQRQQDFHNQENRFHHNDLPDNQNLQNQQNLSGQQEYQFHQNLPENQDLQSHQNVLTHQIQPEHQSLQTLQNLANNQNRQSNQGAQSKQDFPNHQEHQLHQDILSQPDPAGHHDVRNHQVLPDHQDLQALLPNQELSRHQDLQSPQILKDQNLQLHQDLPEHQSNPNLLNHQNLQIHQNVQSPQDPSIHQEHQFHQDLPIYQNLQDQRGNQIHQNVQNHQIHLNNQNPQNNQDILSHQDLQNHFVNQNIQPNEFLTEIKPIYPAYQNGGLVVSGRETSFVDPYHNLDEMKQKSSLIQSTGINHLPSESRTRSETIDRSTFSGYSRSRDGHESSLAEAEVSHISSLNGDTSAATASASSASGPHVNTFSNHLTSSSNVGSSLGVKTSTHYDPYLRTENTNYYQQPTEQEHESYSASAVAASSDERFSNSHSHYHLHPNVREEYIDEMGYGAERAHDGEEVMEGSHDWDDNHFTESDRHHRRKKSSRFRRIVKKVKQVTVKGIEKAQEKSRFVNTVVEKTKLHGAPLVEKTVEQTREVVQLLSDGYKTHRSRRHSRKRSSNHRRSHDVIDDNEFSLERGVPDMLGSYPNVPPVAQ